MRCNKYKNDMNKPIHYSHFIEIFISFCSIDEDSCCMIIDDQPGPSIKPKKEYMRAKLLQFHENYRPAYYGTWRKLSKGVGPRKPLGKDMVWLFSFKLKY